jgi:hypothetical protein
MRKIRIKRTFFGSIFILVFSLSKTFCIDNAHYYKAPYWHAIKSWKSKKWLSILDFQYANGGTRRAKNFNGDRTETFDLYGNHNILYLTKSVPQPSNLSSTIQGYVNALDAKRVTFENTNPAGKENFGLVGFSGKCEVDEFIINYRQNLIFNFFVELNIPIRNIRTSAIVLNDKTAIGSGTEDFTQKDTDWTNFRDNLDEILLAYGFAKYSCGSHRTGLGDIAFIGGWQTQIRSPLDFIENLKLAARLGFLFPTAKKRNLSEPFSIEAGYNRHFGVPLRGDALFVLSRDIQIGSYLGVIFFSSKTHRSYPVKTNERQNGFIKLYKATVREKKGTLFDVGTYLKLDHFFKGLSALVGYSYNLQNSDSLHLCGSPSQTNTSIIGGDSRLKSWSAHVLHILAEYDFGAHLYFKKRKWQPRVTLFYDYPFDGKRIIVNPMAGGSIGVDISFIV